MPRIPMAEASTTNENFARLNDRMAPRRHEREAKPAIVPQHIRKPETSKYGIESAFPEDHSSPIAVIMDRAEAATSRMPTIMGLSPNARRLSSPGDAGWSHIHSVHAVAPGTIGRPHLEHMRLCSRTGLVDLIWVRQFWQKSINGGTTFPQRGHLRSLMPFWADEGWTSDDFKRDPQELQYIEFSGFS
jgi:hypothetical protein